MALSDLFDIVDSAGNDLIPPACDGLEQTGSTLGIERAKPAVVRPRLEPNVN